MKAQLVPLYFPGRDEDFDTQSESLRGLLSEVADILEPAALGSPIPDSADAVLFPQMLGDAYRMLDEFKAIDVPIMVNTSEFGAVIMWDWEIVRYLRNEGIQLLTPYNIEQSISACKALSLKRDLKQTKFLVYQDNPGEGFQAEIFKRFYWWEDECIERMKAKFGFQLEKRSFKELGAAAKLIPDSDAKDVWNQWRDRLNIGDINDQQVLSALKIYIAVNQALKEDPNIKAVGINCLNESHFSDTTPCLAWNMLFEEGGYIWGCEADIVSMMTKYILYQSLETPIMMTNIYPFLMGQAALKHEHIPHFPETDDPVNHVLLAHCGYLGVVPQSFSTEWELKSKVLEIVDENATAIDARLPEGKMTLAKLDPTMDTIIVLQGDLTGYSQFPGSHCLNGAVVRVSDGHRMVSEVSSHHYLLMTGHNLPGIEILANIFDWQVEEI